MEANKLLWVEKYRPQTIDECIIPDRYKKMFNEFIAQGQIPTMMLAGPAGIGKTTIARALARELKADLLFINASIDRNIDVLRNDITRFAANVSMLGGNTQKIVILDEADGANANSFQPALKAFIEEFSDTCRFILTCNFKNKLIDAIHSRCSVIEFNLTAEEQVQMQASFFNRLRTILRAEEVEFDNAALAEFVKKFYPDFRRSIQELQRYGAAGKIDTGILSILGDMKVTELTNALRTKNFADMRQWVKQNSDLSQEQIFRAIYDTLSASLESRSVPEAILILGEAQKAAAIVADPEINVVATCIQLMMSCEFTK